ncbi:hypothetical protein QOZ80_5AG0391590 [Eleusine coracana subsp. coracana]|nr:hypothetical protein QOZ80_5AG0391590 [Eleusine coracana subsp. coracana]
MAEIAGMLAASVLKVAAGKMAEAAGDRVMLQWRFGDDLEDMEDTVESIQAVLEDAEGQSIVNASVRLWLKRLTRASNDISDMFDEFEVNKTRKSSLGKIEWVLQDNILDCMFTLFTSFVHVLDISNSMPL